MGANVFRSVLGPWGLSRGTQPLSYSGSGPEQRGVGVEPAQHCRGGAREAGQAGHWAKAQADWRGQCR